MIILILLSCYFALKANENKLIESWCRAAALSLHLLIFHWKSCRYSEWSPGPQCLYSGLPFFAALVILFFLRIYKEKDCLKALAARLAGAIKRHKTACVLAAALLFLAVYTVPYNWDSMTYHLSRIANWTQNQSAAHYATHNIREIVSPVLAEFLNLHVYILSGEKGYFL